MNRTWSSPPRLSLHFFVTVVNTPYASFNCTFNRPPAQAFQPLNMPRSPEAPHQIPKPQPAGNGIKEPGTASAGRQTNAART